MRASAGTYSAADVVPIVFGFALAICFDPTLYTAATTPRWALLAVALPVLIRFTPVSSPNHFSLFKLLGLGFIAWAMLSLLWTANLLDGIGNLIWLMIITASVVYGNRIGSLEKIFIGLSLGVTFSSLILLLPPLRNFLASSYVMVYPHGLFGNRNMLGEAAILTALGCLAYKQYWYIPGLIPSIIWQPTTRGALLAGLAGLCVWIWPRSRSATGLLLVAAGIAIGVAVGLDYRFTSVTERLEVWQIILRNITLLGHGIGSTFTLTPYYGGPWDTILQRVDHVHNEALEIFFELGLFGIVLYAGLVGIALWEADEPTRIVLIAFLVISCVAFPWHIPTNAFIGALVMGHAVRNGASVRDLYARWRQILRTWNESCWEAIPGQYKPT